MVRERVSATVDAKVARDVALEHKKREKIALDTGEKTPIYSHTVEDILKHGLRDISRRQ